MKILLDTNFILRVSRTNDPMHQAADAALKWIYRNHHEPVVVPQVLYEYWAVATRPTENNGLGSTPEDADQDITDLLGQFQLLGDEVGIFPAWRTLVTQHAVKGKTAHDARLVAAMRHHGIEAIMTFNKADFSRFSTIKAMSPADVSTGISR